MFKRCILFLFLVYLPAAWALEPTWPILLGEHRTQAYVARDVYRHPYQTLQFFGLNQQSTVVEIWPGGGWYTELLAPYLQERGLFYAAHFSATSSIPFYRSNRVKFEQKLAANPDVYDKVKITTLMPPEQVKIAPDNSADFVLTFRNVHNWLKAGKEEAVFNAMYAALKPGGVLGVVEHRAKPGTSDESMIRSGYVTEAVVMQLAAEVGFEFVAASEINANPKDSAVHPYGVWTLPPTLRGGSEGRDTYLAIGESDRMTLKFIKPTH